MDDDFRQIDPAFACDSIVLTSGACAGNVTEGAARERPDRSVPVPTQPDARHGSGAGEAGAHDRPALY